MTTNASNSDTSFGRHHRRPTHKELFVIWEFIRQYLADQDHFCVHGSLAWNAHLPTWLQFPTKDIDVLTTLPHKEVASDLCKKLGELTDNRWSFFTKASQHDPTSTVRVCGGKIVYVDLTHSADALSESVVRRFGKAHLRVKNLQFLSSAAKALLQDAGAEYRHSQEECRLQRLYHAQRHDLLVSDEVSKEQIDADWFRLDVDACTTITRSPQTHAL